MPDNNTSANASSDRGQKSRPSVQMIETVRTMTCKVTFMKPVKEPQTIRYFLSMKCDHYIWKVLCENNCLDQQDPNDSSKYSNTNFLAFTTQKSKEHDKIKQSFLNHTKHELAKYNKDKPEEMPGFNVQELDDIWETAMRVARNTFAEDNPRATDLCKYWKLQYEHVVRMLVCFIFCDSRMLSTHVTRLLPKYIQETTLEAVRPHLKGYPN